MFLFSNDEEPQQEETQSVPLAESILSRSSVIETKGMKITMSAVRKELYPVKEHYYDNVYDEDLGGEYGQRPQYEKSYFGKRIKKIYRRSKRAYDFYRSKRDSLMMLS